MTRDFQHLVDLAMENFGIARMRPVIEKELLHYDILFALQEAGFLDGLVFQGGTALRLCHGAPRFSEDLDFAGGPDFTSSHLEPLADHLKDFLSGCYGLPFEVRPPKTVIDVADHATIVVSKWRLGIMMRPSSRALPRQKINLDIANVPSHANELSLLKRNHDFMPDGYKDMMVRVETKEEILADKLVAFPESLSSKEHRPRWRDIWDIDWLSRSGTHAVSDLVRRKVQDYRIDGFDGLLETAATRMPELARSEGFVNEMGRFLTDTTAERTIRNENWLQAIGIGLRERLASLRHDLMPHS